MTTPAKYKQDGTPEYFSAYFCGIPVYSPVPPSDDRHSPITNLDITEVLGQISDDGPV